MKEYIILSLLLTTALTTIPHLSATTREVTMKDTYLKIVDFIRAGKYTQFKNTNAFNLKTDETLGRCGPKEPQPWKFMGFKVAALNSKTTQSDEWRNFCFKKNSASFRWINERTAEVTITSTGKTATTKCSDTYALTDIFNHDLKVIDTEGDHKIIYTFEDDNEVEYVKKWGLKILRLCDSHVDLLPDVLLTLKLFLADPFVEGPKGEKVPSWLRDYVYKYHYKWLHKWQGMKLFKRKQKAKIDGDWMRKNAKSGDILCRFAGTGLSSLIMWGTGSRCSHIAMFMWGRGTETGDLFVVQSNGRGIWKQPVDDFWKENDGTAVAMLPLHPDWRKKFDTEKAWNWFETVKGEPYGFGNFLFGYFDTPNQNFPQVIDEDSWMTFMMILNDLPFAGKKVVDFIWTRALNKRLGTEGLDFKEVVAETVKRGMTLGELMAVPEKEEWL